MVTLLYFAWLRERVGTDREQLALPATVQTVRQVIGWLSQRDEPHRVAFAEPERIRCAVNQRMGSPAALVADGDEIAFFPPMTGG